MADKTDIDYVYIALNDAGKGVVLIADEPNYKEDVANAVAECIRDGYAVKHLPRDEAMEKM